MGSRVGLFCLAVGFLVALIVLVSSACAYRIVWKTDSGSQGGRCQFTSPGEIETAETSKTMAAAGQALGAIFGPGGSASGNCYVDTDGCDKTGSDGNWRKEACKGGSWKCVAGDGDERCDTYSATGTWDVISGDACGDGWCTGAETKCSCPADCGNDPNCCGDGTVQTTRGEQCELPNTNNNVYCPQSPPYQCSGRKASIRDSYGNCGSACQCVYDSFGSYACSKAYCSAQCETNSDCPPSKCSLTYTDYCSGNRLAEYDTDRMKDSTVVTNSVANTCTDSCSCTGNIASCPAPSLNTYCVKGVCNAVCGYNTDCPDYCEGNTRYYSGACTSQCACTYSQQDCGSMATCISGACVPRPFLSSSARFEPAAIYVGGKTILKGTVACSNAYCNYVRAYALDAASGKLINDIAGLRVQGSNPYECGVMNPSETCYPSWTIGGNYPGSYQIFLRANNTLQGGASSDSLPVTLNVNEILAGSLSAAISAEPPTLTAGSTAKVKAVVYCYGGANSYCGNVTSYLFYNGIQMSSSGILFTASPNPSPSCRDLLNGETCDIAWEVNATVTGTYTLSVTAASDYHKGGYNVDNATAQTQLIVNSRPVGVLSIEKLQMNPENQTVVLGGTARLGANIKCISSAPSNPLVVSCGAVRAYPTYDGKKINQSGGGLSVITTERDCGSMSSSGSACPVYWDITGKSLGTYTLAINANSSLAETQNITSDTKALNVNKNLGYLSIPWMEMKPDKINLTSPPSAARLSATLNCTTDYCGKADAALWIGEQILNSSTRVSTSQNIQSCSSFPCSLSWTLAGNSEGSFEINIKAGSNETGILGVSKNARLDVTDPKKPMLSLSTNLGSISASAGQAAQITANVTCLVKDCGQTELSLAYNSGGWKTLPYGNVLMPQGQNPAYANLYAGQSQGASWSVNFMQAGTYELRITAAGSAANITNDERRANVTISNIRGSLQILSPEPNRKFLRGDTVSLKANITAAGKPMTGLAPLVQELNAALYDDGKHNDNSLGDGVYAGDGRVPADASGRYGLSFVAGELENSTCIYVNPALYVDVDAERESYSWGEAIGISGSVRRAEKGDGMPANVTIIITHGKDSTWKYEAVLNTTGHFSYNYSNLDTPNINGTLRITAAAGDAYANSGKGSSDVSLKAAEGVHNIIFLMSKYNYRRGENMTIMAKLAAGARGGSVREVNCTLSGSAAKTLADRDGTYYGDYNVPTDAGLGKKPLSCSFTGGESGTGYAEITIEPMTLNISIISPYDSIYNFVPVTSTEPVELKAAVFYPDNTPVTDGVVEINVSGKKINMTRTGVPGIYSASGVIFTKERSGAAMSSMFLTAQDPHGNAGMNEVDVVVDSGQFNWLWLLLVPLGLVILIFVWYYLKSKEPPKIQIQEKIIRLPGERVREVQRVREVVYRPVAMPQKRIDPVMRLRMELSRLEEKQKTIENAKDLAEQQYYKRQIDEATFNKLVQDYEEKLIEIDASIRQKRKEISEMEPR